MRHCSRGTLQDSLKKLNQYAMLGAVNRAKQNRKGGVFEVWYLPCGCLFACISSSWPVLRAGLDSFTVFYCAGIFLSAGGA
jgi:hypothetical protein